MASPRALSAGAEAEPERGENGGSRLVPGFLERGFEIGHEPGPEGVVRLGARDESYRTIADALGLPSGTIASRISRCLAKLRVELEGRS